MVIMRTFFYLNYYFFNNYIFTLKVNLVKDSLCLLQLKAKYTRALIYQFELNKRSPNFYQELSDVSYYFVSENACNFSLKLIIYYFTK